MHTWLTKTFGLEHPIVGAPMAGRSGGRLAAAVSAGGGLGMIGAGRSVSPDWIAQQAALATAGPFGIGLMTWALPETPGLLAATLATKPVLVSLSFGDPAPYVAEVRASGALVAMQVNTETADVDLVVAQGGEAGGHTGQIATLPLLQEVLETTDRPVVAAGGIATGRGLAAVIAAGAQGAWIGTALLACPETDGPQQARERALGAASHETVYTSVFDRIAGAPWPARWGGRAIENDLSERWHGREDEAATHPRLRQEFRRALDGRDFEIAVAYAGQSVGMVREERPAADVVRTIGVEAQSRLDQLSAANTNG